MNEILSLIFKTTKLIVNIKAGTGSHIRALYQDHVFIKVCYLSTTLHLGYFVYLIRFIVGARGFCQESSKIDCSALTTFLYCDGGEMQMT